MRSIARMSADHQMHVLWEYGAGEHWIVVFDKNLCEPPGHRVCLRTVEDYGWVFQALLCFTSDDIVVTIASDRVAGLYFRCRSESPQMRRCDTI